MPKYLIDVNLPYYFSFWKTEDYIHQFDIDDEWKDAQIWEYAKINALTIVSKDSDFSQRILFTEPPPKVVHIKFGNLKMKDFHKVISENWNEVLTLSETHKLVNVFKDRIEAIN